ncbi:endonuclease/exonuclease/phosphatase family protein [Paenibacillus sp. HJGM_3]|uniref:endonuclease/exonuclease/phosphatase family protein n=1 Tax=Paenibacillus sp. HJGM_3 TaxID=3379816 RepID=UPI0038644E38
MENPKNNLEERERKLKLTILTYNICHGLGIDGVQNFDRTIEEILSIGADLVGLQEVDCRFGERSGWEDQARRLAESLGMAVVFGPNLDMEPSPEYPTTRRQYGTAILSRYPVAYSVSHRLPQIIVPGAWNEVRGLLEAHVQVDGATLRFLNTHLGLTTEERSVQVDTILELVNRDQDRFAATVMTGDFNAEPGSPELATLKGSFQDAYAAAHEGGHVPTFMQRIGGIPTAVSCIDYIWCSASCKIVGAEVMSTYTSDHLPLVARVELGS